MNVSIIKESLGLWITCGIMISVILIQSTLFLLEAKKEAKKIGISKEKVEETIRVSVITSIGPGLALAVMCIALMAVMGTPTSWMRISDVGAGRTELALASMVKDMVGSGENSDLRIFSYGLWAQAVDVAGWLLSSMILICSMEKITNKMNEKLDPKWIKVLTGGVLVSLFSYLTISQIYQKPSPYTISTLFGAICMFTLNKIFSKNRRMQEFSLGISMVVGVVAAMFI